jgi:hypothetical protein
MHAAELRGAIMDNARRLTSSVLALTIATVSVAACALESCGTPSDLVFSNGFGIGPTVSAGAETAIGPVTGVDILPDEHSSFLPPATAGATYTFFEAARVSGSTGAVVLQASNDLQTWSLAPGYTSPVLGSPKPFGQCASVSDPAYLNTLFDENYAAPGSVVQDPTLPVGNLMMIYEGENHCRQDAAMVWHNVQPYYATAGFARSSDNGVTWPAPGLTPGTLRYPIIGGPDPKPAYDAASVTAVGDAIPSAYVKGSCLYVVYAHHPAPDASAHAIAIQIARAQLDGTTNPLTFQKYLVTNGVGGFTSPGLTGDGANVIPFTPIGAVVATPVCTGTQYQPGLSFNVALQRYLMTMVCEVSSTAGQLGWFFSTATSLDAEDWSAPQMIENTQSTAQPCSGNSNGTDFDGWYPSIYSLTLEPGRTGKNDIAFYLDGCNLDPDRTFKSRTITVTPDPG